jgi:hypothetical protein
VSSHYQVRHQSISRECMGALHRFRSRLRRHHSSGKPYTSNPKARYDQHQIGFTIGGHIWKDKLYGFEAPSSRVSTAMPNPARSNSPTPRATPS